MKVVVTYIEEGIYYYPELAEWVRSLGKNPHDATFDVLSLMEGDPDIIKYNGNKMYFIDTVIGDIRFVLTSDEVNPKEKEMLSRFHGENRDDFYGIAESSWKVFDSLPNAIAYRGGIGYIYEINNYKGQ